MHGLIEFEWKHKTKQKKKDSVTFDFMMSGNTICMRGKWEWKVLVSEGELQTHKSDFHLLQTLIPAEHSANCWTLQHCCQLNIRHVCRCSWVTGLKVHSCSCSIHEYWFSQWLTSCWKVWTEMFVRSWLGEKHLRVLHYGKGQFQHF